jgi:magnesium-transporting ATPase (P-type)
LTVYTKGADIVINRLSTAPRFESEVHRYATIGLRTLVFAKRVLSAEFAADWTSEWHRAASSIGNRDADIAAAALRVECELEITGTSAVEDRLQPRVRETIQWLRDAGLYVWVLTGDRLETAVEIGRTSAVIGADSELLVIAQETDDGVRTQFAAYLARFEAGDEMIDPVLVLAGFATERALTEDSEAFMTLAKHCHSVIFCRVSPFQKASLARFLRQSGGHTLAIGDGANDVGMLQEANVGIGVKGREGAQAAQASDFAIPRFRHLVPLIAVHGHWVAHRLTHVSVFMLYKNFLMISVYLWSCFESKASPAEFYDSFLLSFFNLLFTVLPPFAYGLWERDVCKRSLLEFPQLYRQVADPMSFPFGLAYFALGLFQGLVIYFVVRFSMPDGAQQTNGNVSYICVVSIVAFQFMLWSYDWNPLIFITCALTIILVFGIVIAYAFSMTPELIGVVERGIGSLRGWLIMIAAMAGSLLPYIGFRAAVDTGWPDLNRLVRESDAQQEAKGEEQLNFWELGRELGRGGTGRQMTASNLAPLKVFNHETESSPSRD